jgi:hypothetical protein
VPDVRMRFSIDGEESVSQAASSASTGMAGFASKVPGWLKGLAILTVGWDLLKEGIERVKDFALDSMRAFDEYTMSQRRMEAQAKLTGVPLSELTRIAKAAREEFALGAVDSNNAATTVGRYAALAGDASKAQELLSAALKLGRAAGLDAAGSIEALNLGLRGQDEGFDRILGKNPSAFWKEYAKENGLAAATMTDSQKRLAELNAVIEAGNKLGGQLNETNATGARQTQLLSNATSDMKVEFGRAIEPIRTLILRGLVELVKIIGPAIVWTGKIANAIGVVLVAAFNGAQEVLGEFVGGIGKLLRLDSLEKWGREMAENAKRDTGAIIEAYRNAAEKQVESSQRAAVVITAEAEKVTKVTEAEQRKREAALKKEQKVAEDHANAVAKAMNALLTNIDLTAGGFDRLGAKASIALPPGVAAEFNREMEKAAARLGEVRANVQPVPESIKKASGEMGVLARGALDLATSFGVIDRTASTALTSALNIAGAIGKMAATGFSFAGVAGVLGGIANIVSTMTQGDVERRRLLAENSRQLERLREEGIAGVGVSGRIQQSASDALDALFNASPFGLPTGALTRGQTSQLNEMLRRQGLSMAQLDEIARSFSINIRDREGRLIGAGINDLLSALNTGTGVGNSASAQLAALRDRLRVDRVGEGGILQALGQFFGGRSSALSGLVDLNNLDQTFLNLRGRLEALDRGQIDRASFGDLNRGQFRDALLELLGLVNSLRGTTDSTVSSGTPSSTTPPETAVDVGGTMIPVSSAVAADVLRGFDVATATLANLMTAGNRSLDTIAINSSKQVEHLENMVSLLERLRGFTIDEISVALARRDAEQRRFVGQPGVN